jgi:hypothetical protein
VFLINSRLGRFSAARFCSPRKVVHIPRAPLLPKLRGHFAEFLLRGSLEHLRLLASPTCVRLRYGHSKHSPTRLFLAACSTTLCGARGPLRHRFSASSGGFTYRICLQPYIGNPPPDGYFASASPLGVKRTTLWYRNIDLFPIAYAFRPRLRGRLTRSG